MPDLPRDPPQAEPASDVPGRSTVEFDYRLHSRVPDDLKFLSPPRGPGELGWLADFRVMRELGRGGMGIVLYAIDSLLKREVALKVILPIYAAQPAMRERFLREARALAAARNDHVVTIYYVSDKAETPYIAMEFLKGANLAVAKSRGTLTLPQILQVGREIADGLGAAHAKGIIHRDIKPLNIWLEEPHGRVKLLDFGLARIDMERGPNSSHGLTGTAAYMSPEQARSQTLDHRTDLFSLGTTLYELCTGIQPFQRDDYLDTLNAVVSYAPPLVHQVNPNVPLTLSELIGRLMAKSRAARPQSAAEVVQIIRAIELPPPPVAALVPAHTEPDVSPFDDIDTQQQLPTADTIPLDEPAPARRRSRNWMPLLSIAGCIIALGVAFAIMKRSAKQAEPTPAAGEKKAPLEKTKVVTTGPKKEPTPKKENPAVKDTDPDRKAAEWVLRMKGRVRLWNGVAWLIPSNRKIWSGPYVWLGPNDTLPAESFKLVGVNLNRNAAINDASLENLRLLTELHRLDLTSTSLSGENLSALSNCKKLETLVLNFVPVTDAALGQLAGFPLQRLEINDSRLTDRGLETLRRFPLRKLVLGSESMTGAGLAALNDLPELQSLVLTNGNLTDIDLGRLPAYPNLESVWLADFDCSDSFVNWAERLPKLKTLVLEKGGLTDSALTRLAKVKGLAELSFMKAKVNRDALKSFRAARPDCLVLVDRRQDPAGPFPPLDPEWLESVRAMPAESQHAEVEKEMIRRHPRLDYTLVANYEGGRVSGLRIDQSEIVDLTPIQALADLKILDLSGPKGGVRQPYLATLEPLRGMKLEKLFVTGARIADLEPLRGMKMTGVFVSGTRIRDLKPLVGMPLEDLDIGGTDVADLSPIANFTKLQYLSACFIAPEARIDAGVLNALPLKDAALLPEQIDNLPLLRKHRTLKVINGGSVDSFFTAIEQRAADPDRYAAESVLLGAGEISYRQGTKTGVLRGKVAPPKGAFTLTAARLRLSVPIGDAGLAHFRALPELAELALSELDLTAHTVPFLRSIPRLSSLDIDTTKLDDLHLQELASIRQLKSLKFASGHITPEGVRAFQAALPNCVLVIDGQSAAAWLRANK